MKKINFAIIGVGGRGIGMYEAVFCKRSDLNFVGICDISEERLKHSVGVMQKLGHECPAYTDWRKCIDEAKPDAVFIATAWNLHFEIAQYAMERGVAVALEVGGCYSLQQCWELVRCYERTRTPIMLMENCCFGQIETLALNMKRKGLLGEVVYCEGGYHHDLVGSVYQHGNEAFRFNEYCKNNAEDYPTHEIGPIAKLLDINCGNRFVSLYSMATKAVGMKDFFLKNNAPRKDLEEVRKIDFARSDVITTLIKCEHGQMVKITLDTTLPRYYSRNFQVHATEGLIMEENQSVFLRSDVNGECWDWTSKYGNIKEYYEKYNHPLWQNYHPGDEGHGGMDTLVFNAFFEAFKSGAPMPIDVYDAVTWRAITVLSRMSLATGQTVAFPDFTDGKWMSRENRFLAE